MTVRELLYALIVVILSLSVLLYAAYPRLYVQGEKLVYQFAPTQERAIRYADRHFDATNPRLYDMKAAEYFYDRAAEFNTSHPYLDHQLARIAFLHGKFNTARFHIDRQIETHGDALPNSYYMRGLIKGYAGMYDSAAEDYEKYLAHDAENWAAITDYSWVLLKAGRFMDAAAATERGISIWPGNAWLLNTNAIALYELHNYALALERVKKATQAAEKVTEEEWRTAYPGNDPRTAVEGVATIRQATLDNMHKIEAALTASTVQ